jgi:outer membrane protein OmpA-like peptidoglycan-associated protein
MEDTVATSLFTQLINEFKGDTLNTVASTIGETPARTESALGSVLPALIGGLASKTATTGQATALLDIMRRNDLDTGTFADAASAFKAPGGITGLATMGRSFMESLFGGRSGAIADWVSSRSGISRSSSSSLMSLALPIVLGMIARRLKSTGWSASNLMSMLDEQRSSLPDMPGFAAALNPDIRAEAYERDRVYATPAVHEPKSRMSSAWLWVLPLLFLIPLFYLMTRSDKPRRVVQTTQVEVPRARIPDPGRPELAKPEPAKPVGTSGVILRGFGPYKIEFQHGSPGITSAEMNELREVAALLKANTWAHASISGYTDNTGDADANLKLSEARARATMEELASLGVDRSRMSARGYGEEHPVADNATADGRQQNRRVEIHASNQP